MSGETWHGTIGGYTNHRCRKQCCKAAIAAYHRERRRRFRNGEEPIPPWAEHGTLNTATNYACGCRPCRDAFLVYLRDWRNRKRAAS